MLKIIRLEVGELKANCYLVYDAKTKDCVIIDPGDEAEFIETKIAENDLNPVLIVSTHGHFDHVLASLELKLAYQIPFLVSEKDNFLLNRAKATANYFKISQENLKTVADKFLENSDQIVLGQEKLKVVETPGHTPGSVSFYSPKNKILFAGDLFFADGSLGRYDHKYSSREKLLNSVKRLLKLPHDVIVYCGHGPEFYLGDF
jgi:hydroxyacylglutathione hydrolase